MVAARPSDAAFSSATWSPRLVRATRSPPFNPGDLIATLFNPGDLIANCTALDSPVPAANRRREDSGRGLPARAAPQTGWLTTRENTSDPFETERDICEFVGVV